MRRMRRTLISTFAAVLLVCGARVASAQDTAPAASGGSTGGSTGIGVGVEAMLAGPAGPTFVYQASQFHISVIFSFDTGVNELPFVAGDEVGVGGRFFWQIHSGEMADFSLGGGAGIDDDGGGNDDIDVHIEGAAQVRAFIVPNVALHTSLGLALELDDDGAEDDLELAFTGHLLGTVGLTYFFF
jgi:hypothetical protein